MQDKLTGCGLISVLDLVANWKAELRGRIRAAACDINFITPEDVPNLKAEAERFVALCRVLAKRT
jgi:hypothetical protein